METAGNLFCLAALSGAGKSSLVKALLELDSHLAVSVSHTTRQPRGQEQQGRQYWFVAEPAFRGMIDRSEFFEWAEVHGNLYGTSRKAIEQRLMGGVVNDAVHLRQIELTCHQVLARARAPQFMAIAG